MKLYYAKGACSVAPHIILEELQIPFELQQVELKNQSADFLKVNPLGAVPTLATDKGEILTEVAVILQYLGDLKPELQLIPKAGTWERYRAQETLNFISSELHKGIGSFFKIPRITTDPKSQEEQRTFHMGVLAKRFDLVAKRLEAAPYLMGQQFTVADAYLFTVLNWTSSLKIDLAKWPSLAGFLDKMRARPSVQRALKAEGLI